MLLMGGVIVMASALAQKAVSCATWTTNDCLAIWSLNGVIDNTTFII